MTTTDLERHGPSASYDREAILKSLNLNVRDPKTQALLLICERYGLDPLLKHMVLISGNAYVTRDGLMAVAHRSGQFDGMEVTDQSETTTHYIAKVAVYRKDMSHPFTFIGRFPKAKSMAKDYGPEMAVKVAEVMGLRRAFNVTGVGASDERWDDEAVPPDPPAVAASIPVASVPAVPAQTRRPPPAKPVPDDAAAPESVAELVDAMNALPAAIRGQVKAEFVASFGRPDTLPASKLEEAQQFVNNRKEHLNESSGAELLAASPSHSESIGNDEDREQR